MPVIHRDFNAAHLKPPSSTHVPATHSNLNQNGDVHFKMPSTNVIRMTNEAVPTTIRYNALQSPWGSSPFPQTSYVPNHRTFINGTHKIRVSMNYKEVVTTI